MAASMNKVILIGNLGRDPELKMTPGGQPLARFSVATTEEWKNPQGEKQSRTEWHNIVVWGKLAEVCEKYIRKGQQVYIEGRIQYQEYTDQAGVKKIATTIRADKMLMLGKKDGDGHHRDHTRGAEGADEFNQPMPPAQQGGTYDDDIPF